MLQQSFMDLVRTYSGDPALAGQLWLEIEQAYSQPSRQYHTLDHLESLITALSLCRSRIRNYNTLLFSVFYHDVIYDVLQHNNEEQSALFAADRLRWLGVPESVIAACSAQINATQTHVPSGDPDTDLFTDADLSILGKEDSIYDRYCDQVRQEYQIYPDEVYVPGRIKVLQHFLDLERIYKTRFFYERYEEQARHNMLREQERLKTLLP